MSRKKNKKLKATELELEAVFAENTGTPAQIESLPSPPPSEREQLSNMLFNDFLKKKMKIFFIEKSDCILIIWYNY